MAKQTFTTGQVLTAAQMTSLQQTAMGGGSATAKTANYVLVAADAGGTVAMNAAGATTITVNTSLFAAGDTVLIQNLGAGTCTVTAGTATVNTAGSLALVQYESGILYFTATGTAIFNDYVQAGGASGTRGLNQIIPTSVAVGGGSASIGANGMVTTTSATTNISINGVFSSTYTNYKIVFALEPGTSYTSLDMRLRASGTDDTTANSYKLMGGSSSEPVSASGFAGQAISANKFQTFGFIGSDSSTNGGEFILYRPFLAKATSMTSMVSGSAAGGWYFYFMGGSHTQNTSYDGFSILTTQALTGSILIYGWSE
jgi:hypothetical protein